MFQTVRARVLAILSILMLVSLTGVATSFWLTGQVNSELETINLRTVPMQRELVQLGSDLELLNREVDRSFNFQNWRDPRWRPRRIPEWVFESQRNRLVRFRSEWLLSEDWIRWHQQMRQLNLAVAEGSESLFKVLDLKEWDIAADRYPKLSHDLNEMSNAINWAKKKIENETKIAFESTQSQVKSLRLALQILLMVVIGVALLTGWMGERALRPIEHLRLVLRNITERGEVTALDRSHLPEVSLSQQDEVSDLAREFHQMATALIERDRTVQNQKERLEKQNRLLLEMGSLNQDIIRSIPSLLLVCDQDGIITLCSPSMVRQLGAESIEAVVQRSVTHFPWLDQIFQSDDDWSRILKVDLGDFQGSLFPLRIGHENPRGRILLLEDVSESRDLQNRLQEAEHLAAVGRMSAQVAHEVGNPLHSIGLEAELALEFAQHGQTIQLKQSIQTILGSVERLQNIIQNYLRLSKLSPGQASRIDLKSVVESMLATYANQCERQGVKVNWHFRSDHVETFPVQADRDLLEFALGNLMRNSLQALEGKIPGSGRIDIVLSHQPQGGFQLVFADNGPGLPVAVQEKLFRPFMTTKAQGTGLGLSFVKKVFEDLGGQFRLGTTLEKVGTVFEGSLPEAGPEVKINQGVEA